MDFVGYRGGLFLIFTLMILLVLNLSAWWIYLSISQQLESIFNRSLMETAQLAAESLSRDPLTFIDHPSRNTIEYLNLQTHLLKLKASGQFHNLYLIDSSFKNRAGIYPDFKIGDRNGLLILDQPYLEQARIGQIAITPHVETENLFLKTLYCPITGSSQNVEVILVAKANVEFLKPKRTIRNTLIVITGFCAVVVILFALVYWQSLRALQKMETKIIHNERLAILGQLAAGIAHELRNPLGIIEQTMTVLRRRYEKEPDELMDYIPAEVSRMNRLINEFLSLARESVLEIEPADLSDVLERTLNLLDYRLREGKIELRKDYPMLLSVSIDPDKMQQVFLNLCMNAIESMPSGGELMVRANTTHSEEELCITVEDNGQGLSEKELDQIFDPFYTTKKDGTGLGLSVARQIVSQHDGRLEVESTPGQGTRFKVYLKTKGQGS